MSVIIVGHSGPVSTLAFSADGKMLVSGGNDQMAIVWDMETSTTQQILATGDYVSGLVLSPDGKIVASDNGNVWQAVTGHKLRGSRRYMAPVAMSPDGSMLANAAFARAYERTHIILSDMKTGRIQHQFECGDEQPGAIAFSTDGAVIAATGYDSRQSGEAPYFTVVYDLTRRQLHHILPGRMVRLFGADLSPDARIIAVSPDGSHFCNAETGEILSIKISARPKSHDFYSVIALSRDGRLFAAGTDKGDLMLWDMSTGELNWSTKAHVGQVCEITFTYDTAGLATGGEDGLIHLWDCATGIRRDTLGFRRPSIEAVSFVDDGMHISAINEDGAASLWSFSPPNCERWVSSPFGVLALASTRTSGLVKNLWEFDITKLPTTSEVPQDFRIAALSLDGLLIALTTREGTNVIWNCRSRSVECVLRDFDLTWTSLAFSPDNRYLAASVSENKICVVDVASGEITMEFNRDDQITIFAFSHDGSLLATGGTSRMITIWNVRTGKRKRYFHAPLDGICTLAFSPNDEVLAFGSEYGETVWIKGLVRGQRNLKLEGHTTRICSIAFSPHSNHLVSGAKDGTVRLWETDDGALLATFLCLPDNNWVIYSPDSYLSGSPKAGQYIVHY